MDEDRNVPMWSLPNDGVAGAVEPCLRLAEAIDDRNRFIRIRQTN